MGVRCMISLSLCLSRALMSTGAEAGEGRGGVAHPPFLLSIPPATDVTEVFPVDESFTGVAVFVSSKAHGLENPRMEANYGFAKGLGLFRDGIWRVGARVFT